MTPERKTKRFSQSIPLQGAYCSKSTQSHQVQQDTHLHALSKGTLRFPHLELTLFYYRQSRVATICNLSTSVKYLYNCHSIAKSWGKKSFPLALHRSSHGDVHNREPSTCPGSISSFQTPWMTWHYYEVKKIQELGLGRHGGRHMPECPSARWEV